jgi:hypothetical protein
MMGTNAVINEIRRRINGSVSRKHMYFRAAQQSSHSMPYGKHRLGSWA